MTSEELFSKISGGQAVVEWFGSIPLFHHAVILKMKGALGDACSMRIHAWNMTETSDSEGCIATDKHAMVVVSFASVREVQLEDFDRNSIIFNLEFKGTPAQTEISWTSSYGAEGRIVGDGITLALSPGRP